MDNLSLYEIDKENNSDHVATPRYVVEDIYELINITQFKMIWLPFDNYDSQFKLKADELKLEYIATHIFDDLGRDFLYTCPPQGCDLMISNPPFSKQNDIIKRSFDLVDAGHIKSFALLLPLSTLETRSRADMYDKYKDKISIIIFKNRVKFLGYNTSYNKACCWICYNIEGVPPLRWI